MNTQRAAASLDPLRAIRDPDYLLRMFEQLMGRKATEEEVAELWEFHDAGETR